VLTFTPILIALSFYVAARLTAESEGIVPAWIVPYLLNVIAFWFAYQFIPYTKVHFHAAIIAAVVAGIFWEIAKGMFNWYINNLTSYTQIYGSLGTIPVFLLWLFLTWVIVLFGSELAYAIQYRQSNKTSGHEYLEFYSVRAMAEITRLFRVPAENRENTIDRLREAGIPQDMVGDILNLLAQKNLVIFTEDKEYYPAKDPATITVRDVIEAVSGTTMLAPAAAKDPVSQNLKKNFQEAGAQINSTLEKLNLQMLINGSKEAEEK